MVRMRGASSDSSSGVRGGVSKALASIDEFVWYCQEIMFEERVTSKVREKNHRLTAYVWGSDCWFFQSLIFPLNVNQPIPAVDSHSDIFIVDWHISWQMKQPIVDARRSYRTIQFPPLCIVPFFMPVQHISGNNNEKGRYYQIIILQWVFDKVGFGV